MIENLKNFLNEYKDQKIKISQLKKWHGYKSIKIDVTLKIKNAFASIEDCEKIHKLILLWNKKENMDKKLNISVQSESVNKKLVEREDFEECLNRKIKIETKEKIHDRRRFTGFLKKIKDDTIRIESGKEEVELAIEAIKTAQLLLI